MIKDILVHIPTERPSRPVIDGSVSLALAHSTHLGALTVGYVSRDAIPFLQKAETLVVINIKEAG
jgi:hypothetical protein